jgi:hypothetical protein
MSDDEGHSKFTSHRTVGESPPCQQCHHDRHCSIMPRHAATWAQDHNNNHTWTCADAKTRQPSVQAKFTSFPSLRLMTTRSGEPFSLYVTWPPDSQDFIQAVPHHSPTSFPLLTHPIIRTSKHSTEEHALELSLRLDVELWPEPV